MPPLKRQTESLIAEYVQANPKSAAALEEAKAAGIAGGTNRASIYHSPFPLTFVDAKEATAVTADGQKITDMLGNFNRWPVRLFSRAC